MCIRDRPVGVFKTHENSPRVLIANSNLVPHWATWEHFNELDAKGLAMYGQMTAGSWIYIGSQMCIRDSAIAAQCHRLVGTGVNAVAEVVGDGQVLQLQTIIL